MINKPIITYSSNRAFKDCRKKYKLRYVDQLVSITKDQTMYFGTVTHKCLEMFYKNIPLENILEYIQKSFKPEFQSKEICMLTAIMKVYHEKYSFNEFEVIALEEKFEYETKDFILKGKVDGIVKLDGKYYILEHKTASRIDAGYIDRLTIDEQIHIYAMCIQEKLGVKIEGIIYNIIEKSQIRLKKNETLEEFTERFIKEYTEKDLFHRQHIPIYNESIALLVKDIDSTAYCIKEAIEKDLFYKNPSFCFNYNKPCPYFNICRSNDNSLIIENEYERVIPHEELEEKEEPVF